MLMLKLILAGVWSCFVALGSVYATQEIRSRKSAHPAAPAAAALEPRKTREINVPKIADGAIKGYVVVSFAYIVDPASLDRSRAPPDAYVVEEAFRAIYDDDTIDFSRPKKYDFKILTDAIRKNINARLKSDVIVDVMLQELHFIPGSDVRQKI